MHITTEENSTHNSTCSILSPSIPEKWPPSGAKKAGHSDGLCGSRQAPCVILFSARVVNFEAILRRRSPTKKRREV